MNRGKENVLLGALGGIFVGGCGTGMAYNLVHAAGGVFVIAGALGVLAGAAMIVLSYARVQGRAPSN